MALFGSKDQFCTQCGKKLDKKEIICSECNTVIDAKKVQKRDAKALAELKSFAGGTIHDKGDYRKLLTSHGISYEFFKPIKNNVKKDITKYHIAPESVRNRIMEYVMILSKIENLFNEDEIKFKIKEIGLNKEDEDSWVKRVKLEFKNEALRNPDISLTQIKVRLKSKIDDKKLKEDKIKEEAEKRKQEQLEKERIIREKQLEKERIQKEKRKSLSSELDKMDMDSVFKQKVAKEINEFPVSEMTTLKFLIEKVKNEEERLKRKIENTREFNVSIPYDKKNPSPLMGAIAGDVIAGGAGRAIGGLANAGSTFDALGGAATGGLILGGAGALIGALASAADDGIGWYDTRIILNNTSMIFAGKSSIPLSNIKHIEITHNKKYGEIVSLTLLTSGILFKVNDADLFKKVVENLIANLNKEVNEKTQNLIEEKKAEDALSSEVDKADALLKYANLLEKGLITKEEFEAKKKELL